MNLPEIAFELVSPEAKSPGIPVTGPADFAAALQALGGRAVLMEVTPAEEGLEEEGGDGMDRQRLGPVDELSGWTGALELIRRSHEWVYMNGDCWHLALAFDRIFGLDLVAVVNHRGEGDPSASHPDHRPFTVGHVAAVLPDGRYLDIRGPLDGDEALCRGAATTPEYSVRISSREEILAILDGYATEDGGDQAGFPWDDPASYPFAAVTETIARTLFAETVEEATAPTQRSSTVKR